MKHINSNDGTEIAYEKLGKGEPLIIIGGALADHNSYSSLTKSLSKNFTVYNYDRRGRGKSGNTLPYSVEREIEDIAALIDEAGKSVILYGHSAGSALAILVAASNPSIASLVLSDPPFTPHTDNDSESVKGFIDEFAKVQELHDKGRHSENATLFLSGFGMSETEIANFLESPAGSAIVSCAKALPYDYAVLGNGLVPTENASRITVPTKILTSGYSLEAGKQLADVIKVSENLELSSSIHEMSSNELATLITSLV